MDILQELDKAGAVYLDRHFIYTSGKHGSGYINLDPIYTNVSLVSDLCRELIAPFHGQVDTVAAPAVGGIVLAVLSARAFADKGEDVAITWADKADGEFIFERAAFAQKLVGKRVLVVEDLLTTGGSVDKVCRTVEAAGGQLVGISVVCNRGDLTAEKLGVPKFEALASVSFSAMDPASCELCDKKVPIVEDIGHGADYKVEHPGYTGGYIKLLGA